MAGGAPLVGGPLDGIAAGPNGAWRWFDRRGRGHAGPGPGRHLYRWAGGRWEYAGHGARACGGCGGILSADPDSGAAAPRCPLCGAAAR